MPPPARALALPALLAAALAAPLPAQDLFIAGARLVDPAARTVRDGNVLIRDGVIAGFPAAPPAGFRGAVLDAGGRWVMPALADMHTHSVGNFAPPGGFRVLGAGGTARAALFAGVGRFLDLFSLEDSIFAARDRQAASGAPGAEILAAGPCLTATRGHCSEYGVPTRIVDSPADAAREVAALAPKRPDVVKVVYDHQTYGNRTMPTIDRPTLEAVVAEARARGLSTVVHVGTWEDVRHAVLAGAAAVTHTPGGPLPDDLPALMAERGTLHIPTLAVQGDLARITDDPALLDSPLLRALADSALLAGFRPPLPPRLAGWATWQRSLLAANAAAVRTLAAAGVPMVTGTDGGNPAVFQGWSVHRELRLLVEAGLPPWEALAAATVNAGRLVDRRWGLAEGHEGTLVVLDGSPADDIRNTERIHAVIQRGRIVDRDALRPAGR
jgi:imidazolonepropionase-like amidohydrolase